MDGRLADKNCGPLGIRLPSGSHQQLKKSIEIGTKKTKVSLSYRANFRIVILR